METQFREDWAAAIGKLKGVSAGARRALGAHAEADVGATLETIHDHAMAAHVPIAVATDDHRWTFPLHREVNSSLRLVTAWRAWHPTYVDAELARLLPDLAERWPTKEARWKENAGRQKRKRWADDGERIVARLADGRWHARDQVRGDVGLQPGRFGRLVGVLTHIDAVRLRGDLLLAVASPEWAREKMHALSPSI